MPMTFLVSGFQFFSRPTVAAAETWGIRTRGPISRPDISVELSLSFGEKAFPLTFADLRPRNPDVGAHEHVDRDIDGYFAKRWPTCLWAQGVITVAQGNSDESDDTRNLLMLVVRRLMWEHPPETPSPYIPTDQRATVEGFRREFAHRQTLDILGTRRKSPVGIFGLAEVGDPVGPGLVNMQSFTGERVDELIWSQVLRYPGRTAVEADKAGIRRALDAMTRRYNAHGELRDAERHRDSGDVKAAVRSAASAVEATVKYLSDAHGLPGVPRHARDLPFNEKVEAVLQAASRPSFAALEPTASIDILHLYRARNSMHEGDCYFDRADDSRVRLHYMDAALPLLTSADLFVGWVESLA